MEKVTLMVGNKEAKQRILMRATFQKATGTQGEAPKVFMLVLVVKEMP